MQIIERLVRIATSGSHHSQRLHDLFIVVARTLAGCFEVALRHVAHPEPVEHLGALEQERGADVALEPVHLGGCALGLEQQSLGGAGITASRGDAAAAPGDISSCLLESVALSQHGTAVEGLFGVVEPAQVDQHVRVRRERCGKAIAAGRVGVERLLDQSLGERDVAMLVTAGIATSQQRGALPLAVPKGSEALGGLGKRSVGLSRRFLRTDPSPCLSTGEHRASEGDLMGGVSLGQHLLHQCKRLLEAARTSDVDGSLGHQLEPPLPSGGSGRRDTGSEQRLETIKRSLSLVVASPRFERPDVIQQRRGIGHPLESGLRQLDGRSHAGIMQPDCVSVSLDFGNSGPRVTLISRPPRSFLASVGTAIGELADEELDDEGWIGCVLGSAVESAVCRRGRCGRSPVRQPRDAVLVG